MPGYLLHLEFQISDQASLTAFKNNPQVFFDWLRPLITETQNAKPNNAHLALALLEKRGYLKSIITQNIDDLHNKAKSVNIIEIHGSLNSFQCHESLLRL